MKTPVILQRSSYECGYAVLAMLFSSGDSKVSINQLVKSSDKETVGRDGTSLAELKEITEKNKANLRIYKINDLSIFVKNERIKEPFLAYINNNHYIVVEKIKNANITIIDPQHGKRRITLTDFEDMYSGYIGILEKGGKNKEIFKQEKKPIVILLSWLAPQKKLLTAVIAISLIYQILNLIYPLAAQQIIDQNTMVFSSFSTGTLLLILFILSVFYFCMNTIQSKLVTQMQIQINKNMTSQFINKIFKVPLQYIENNSIGTFSNTLSNIQIIRDILTNLSSSVIINVSLIIIYSIIMLVYSIPLFLIVCFFVLFQTSVLIYYSKKISEFSNREIYENSSFQNYFLESLRNYNYIKTVGNSKSIVDITLHSFNNQLKAYKQRMDVSIMLGSISSTIHWGLPIIIFIIGVTQQKSLSITIGQLIGFSTITMRFLGPIGSLFEISQSITIIEQMYGRVENVLSQEEESEDGILIDSMTEDIKLHNVKFSYGNTTILNNVNVQFNYGEKILIRGKTGEGKTTLFKILSRLYKPSNGELYLGNIPYSEININSMRRKIGYITQDNNLISGTILDNITLFNSKITVDEVKRAAKLACIHDEIETFPMKYDTILGDNGASLSGGQRQRIAIARTLVTHPQLLLIDEGTSNLDIETESKVVENIFSLPATILFISHRHKNIDGIDKIYSLKNKNLQLLDAN